MNKSRKVLIGIPTYEGHAYCRDEFIENTIALAGSDHDVLVLWNGEGDPSKIFPATWKTQVINQSSKESGLDVLVRKHNIMSKRTISGGYSHLFLLESDVFPPTDTIDRLLKHDVDMVAAIYLIRFEDHTVLNIPDNEMYRKKYNGTLAGKTVLAVRDQTAPVIWGIEGEAVRFWEIEDMMKQRGLVRIFATGVGSSLIKRKVLMDISWKIPPEDLGRHCDDFPFYYEAYHKGYELFADTDILCQHRHNYTKDGDFYETKQKWFSTDRMKEVEQRDAGHIFT
jgi:hypothetical protein